MEWTDTALVLRLGHFREADVWLRLLTRRHGLVSAFAFGASRSRRRFCGCLDLFNELMIRAKSTRNGQYLALQEGALLNGPRRLRANRDRFGMFMNCVCFAEVMGIPPDAGESLFPLFRKVLGVLEEREKMGSLFPLLFRLRFASEMGYAPAFSACQTCGRAFPDLVRFLISEGSVLCPRCSGTVPGRGGSVELSASALRFLCTVQHDDPEFWEEEALLPQERRECARAIDAFVQYHLGITWEKGRFRRQ